MVVSHADNDHSGGALSVQKALPVSWLASSLPRDHPARGAAAPHYPCVAGQSWRWDALSFEFLHPPPRWLEDAKFKTNALSCVLRISDGRHVVLLTGDIEAAQEDLLVRTHGTGLRADVLLVPHHGSKTSSTDDFLDAVAPRFAVFQTGYRNRFGHPAPEVWARYGLRPVQRLRSDAHGAVIFDFTGQEVAVRRIRVEQPRWWRTQVASP
jgi:competence protein ComEC